MSVPVCVKPRALDLFCGAGDWMTRGELSESIPPAYSEFIGRQILDGWTAESAGNGTR